MKLAAELSGGARETLRCLFFHGPTWDGDIPSKVGRSQLVDAGYADHRDGFAYLTGAGIQAALGLDLDRAKEKWQRDRGAWQPIATAPKDGMRIILCQIGPTRRIEGICEGREPFVWWACQGYWHEDRQCWTDGLEQLAPPTHWLGVPGRWIDAP